MSLLTIFLLACSGSDPAPDSGTETGTPVATGDTAVPVESYEPTWDGMQAFFAEHCDSCHPATNGIELRETMDVYVVPGDPEASRLWISVTGQSLSTMMPPTGRLPQETIDHVEEWILEGANQ